MTEKKKPEKYCFIHMKDEPVVYGNLTLLLFEYGLDRNEYFGKEFPFEVGGYPVYRKKMNRGTVAGRILQSIVDEFKNYFEAGSVCYEFEDDFFNKIRLCFDYSGGKFKMESFDCRTKEGHLIKTPLTIQRIEKALNGQK